MSKNEVLYLDQDTTKRQKMCVFAKSFLGHWSLYIPSHFCQIMPNDCLVVNGYCHFPDIPSLFGVKTPEIPPDTTLNCP